MVFLEATERFFFFDIFWGPFRQGYTLGCRGLVKGPLDLGVKDMGVTGMDLTLMARWQAIEHGEHVLMIRCITSLFRAGHRTGRVTHVMQFQ